jgi:hypothetical protein
MLSFSMIFWAYQSRRHCHGSILASLFPHFLGWQALGRLKMGPIDLIKSISFLLTNTGRIGSQF